MIRTLNFALKLRYLTIFWLELEKTILMLDFITFNLSKCNISYKKTFLSFVLCYFTSAPSKFSNIKFYPKMKVYKFGTKIALIGYFVLEFQKTNVVFEIGTLEFFKLRNFMEKLKYLNLAKKSLIWVFWG